MTNNKLKISKSIVMIGLTNLVGALETGDREGFSTAYVISSSALESLKRGGLFKGRSKNVISQARFSQDYTLAPQMRLNAFNQMKKNWSYMQNRYSEYISQEAVRV